MVFGEMRGQTFWQKRERVSFSRDRRDLTLHPAKLEIKRIFRESFRLTASRVARDKPWSTLGKKSHGIPSSPRAAAVAKFRLLTGHDCLCAHLFRFNLVTSLICVLCDTGQDMTAAHLDECSALNDLNCIDIMPSGLTVHRVLIAPRDSILQNVETVIQSMFHLAVAPLEEPPRDSDPPVLHFTRDLLQRTTTSLWC
ncbi:uncharacterized protein TNCV_471391 [Trichonephila clavipes]|nr:uncharacterized protein TNCV_471391 [Trichonephila clavipes]